MPAPVPPFVKGIRAVLHTVRRDVIQALGLRPTITTIRTRTWSQQDARLGASTDSDLLLYPYPKVTYLNATDVDVGPIVPLFPGGGYTPEQLNPMAYLGTARSSTEVLYILDGPNGTYQYTCVGLETRRPFRYILHLRSLNRSAPI